MPYTPLPTAAFSSTSTSGGLPSTAQTPFTPFALPISSSLSTSPSATLLYETDDPLAGLYIAVLKFVAKDLVRVMEVAEAVCVRSGSGARSAGSASNGAVSPVSVPVPPTTIATTTTTSEADGFEILANVVWAEIGRAIMDELGSTVFAAGRPDEFRRVCPISISFFPTRSLIIRCCELKHHETTGAFIRAVEMLAPSIRSVHTMRAHPVFVMFERRWQLPVYFQLRWKEIVGHLEEQLAAAKLERVGGKGSLSSFEYR